MSVEETGVLDQPFVDHRDQGLFEPDVSFLNELERKSGVKVSACFQCRKCSNGCPTGFAMDLLPNQLVEAIRLGLKEEVLRSASLWVCAACETCSTRCPNGIDIARVMDTLRQWAAPAKKKLPPRLFHGVFLNSVRKRGRVYELGVAQAFILKSGRFREKFFRGQFWGDLRLGWTLLIRGKLTLWPVSIRGLREIRRFFEGARTGKRAKG